MRKNIIIISDVHLTPKYDKEKDEKLTRIFNKADKIIINGDFIDNFWDYNKTFRTWRKITEILAKKETIYIFGNHDPGTKEFIKVISKFTKKQVEKYLLKLKDKELIIFHGDQICPKPSTFINKTPKNLKEKIKREYLKMMKLITYPFALKYMEFSHKHPKTFGKKYIENSLKKENEQMKNWAKTNLKKNQILVCGHTHLPISDLKHNFINSGCNTYGKYSYILIKEDKIKLLK